MTLTHRGVMVIGEQRGGKLHSVSYELLARGEFLLTNWARSFLVRYLDMRWNSMRKE